MFSYTFTTSSVQILFPIYPLHHQKCQRQKIFTLLYRRRLSLLADNPNSDDLEPTQPDVEVANSTPPIPDSASKSTLQKRNIGPDLPSDDSGSRSGDSNNGSGEGGGGSGEGCDDHDEDSQQDASPVATPVRDVRDIALQFNETPVRSTVSFFATSASNINAQLLFFVRVVLKAVPAPVIVAFISLASTAYGTRYKARRNLELAMKKERAASKRRKDEIEEQLRKTYSELAAPILKSAAKMAERLHVLLGGEWESLEKKSLHKMVSPIYSAYLLGRYLAMVEIIKKESALLDFGFAAGDRMLVNILGRVQGVLAANDDVLMEMQRTEHFFQPGSGQSVLKGGPLRITARGQTVLGELLLRKLWVGRYAFVEKADTEQMRMGPTSVLSFLEFSRLLETEKTVGSWYRPVVDEFAALEAKVKRTPKEKRRVDRIGARMYFLQNGLLDLVEFFDPLPLAQAVPLYRRPRLQLGPQSHGEEQRIPMSLRLLYRELANMRDHRLVQGNQSERLKLPLGAVEVHVKAALKESESAVQMTKAGDCPYSHRVRIVLEETGIPYQTVYHAARSKPVWFYLLHPGNKVPVAYHNGNLVEDSSHIVAYLLERHRFPSANEMSSAEGVRLNVGTSALTKFHNEFLSWVENGVGKENVERELQSLDQLIERTQKQNNGAPFLGGERFSREDTAIAPMLSNVDVAGKGLLQWEMPKDCQALRKYLAAAREVDSFKKTVGTDQAIVDGYQEYRGKSKVGNSHLADMIE